MSTDSEKVVVYLNSVGNAPKLKNKGAKFSSNDQLCKVATYLRSDKALNVGDSAPLFLYVRQSFAPSLDEKIGVLAQAFGSEGKHGRELVINYALTSAWG